MTGDKQSSHAGNVGAFSRALSGPSVSDVYDRARNISDDVGIWNFAFAMILFLFVVFIAIKGELGTYASFFIYTPPAGTPGATPQITNPGQYNQLGQPTGQPSAGAASGFSGGGLSGPFGTFGGGFGGM